MRIFTEPQQLHDETIRALSFFMAQFKKGIAIHDALTQVEGSYGILIKDCVLFQLKRTMGTK